MTSVLRDYREAWRRPPARTTPDGAALRRRRVVVGTTLVVGTAVNAWALHIPAWRADFYPATALLAAVWTVGALASGPVGLGREPGRSRRPWASSVLVAVVLAATFCLGALVVARIDVLREPVQHLLDHARAGYLPAVAVLTAVNGVAEELMHRGAVYAAAPRRPVLVSTTVYALVTATSGIPLLVLAAVLLGLVTALQRRVTGGVLGPIVTHVAWSMVMLFALGPILDAAAG